MAEEMLNIEHLPYLADEKLKDAKYQMYPLSDFSALGVSIQPMVAGIQSIVSGEGGTGMYWVDTKGKSMYHKKGSTAYKGSMPQDSGAVGGGTADLYSIPFDPTMMFMAVALSNIESKLESISEMQQEMMNFLKAKEKAKIRGNINTLIDILNNYKFNWDNEKYKTSKHILVQDIRREAEQSIQLCRDQLHSIMEKKTHISGDQEAKSKMRKVEDVFKDYQLALYQYAFSSYLEILLLENFESDYINSMEERVEDLSLQYREIYTDCYNQLESMLEGSIQSALSGGVAGLSKGVGETIAKIPVISKGPVDEALIASSKWIDEKNNGKASKELSGLTELSSDVTTSFIQEMEDLKELYNEPKEIYFDQNYLYMVEAS